MLPYTLEVQLAGRMVFADSNHYVDITRRLCAQGWCPRPGCRCWSSASTSCRQPCKRTKHCTAARRQTCVTQVSKSWRALWCGRCSAPPFRACPLAQHMAATSPSSRRTFQCVPPPLCCQQAVVVVLRAAQALHAQLCTYAINSVPCTLQSLAQCMDISATAAVAALRHANGDLARALRCEALRVPLNTQPLHAALLQYCKERGLSAGVLASKHSSPAASMHGTPGAKAEAASPRQYKSGTRSGDACSLELPAVGTVGAVGDGTVPESAGLGGFGDVHAFEAWLDSLEAAVMRGDADEADSLLSRHRGADSLAPVLAFKLQRLRFLSLACAGDWLAAQTVASGQLGTLASRHEELLPQLKARCYHVVMCLLPLREGTGCDEGVHYVQSTLR